MHNVIAVVFDFDDTLAPDSTLGFLRTRGVSPVEFCVKTEQLVNGGWDPVPAYLYNLYKLSSSNSCNRITVEHLIEWGKNIRCFNGVTTLFGRLRSYAQSINPDCQLECYLVSSGLGDVLRSARIAHNFNDIWACEFHYGKDGGIAFPKRIISFTDKTRYLFQIVKGFVGPEYDGKPYEVNRSVPKDEERVPFSQMIFVGDGYTDIPCFSLVRKYGGIAFGVYDPHNQDKWGRAWEYATQNRVTNIAPADYGKNSPLAHNLLMAVGKIAADIALGKTSYQR